MGVRNGYGMTKERGTNFGTSNSGKIVLTNFDRWTNFINILLKGKDGFRQGPWDWLMGQEGAWGPGLSKTPNPDPVALGPEPHYRI